MGKQVRQSFLSGAFILVIATVIVKIIGAIYKIPLYNILLAEGTAYYSTAYSIYNPIYVLATVGLPAAVSRVVAEQYSKHQYLNIRKILRIALGFFLVTGTVGAALMFFIPELVPASWNWFDPQASWAIKALAPTLLFVCVMSAFRGYNEGLRNMYPTAVSQVIEAICKLGFGLFFANYAIQYGLGQQAAGNGVYGVVCADADAAVKASLPYAAAGGIIGVTVGAFIGMCFLLIRHRVSGGGLSAELLQQSDPADESGVLLRKLLKIAVPIGIGAVALNFSGIIDNITINSRLASLIEKYPSEFSTWYAAALADPTLGASSLEKLPNYLWGVYNHALVFFNLVPMITANFGVSALPSITQYWTEKNVPLLHANIERAIRVPALIAYPAALGLAVLARPILTMFYLRSIGSFGIDIAAPLLQILALTLLFGALCTTMGSILQGLGRPDIQVKVVFGGIALKLLSNFVLLGIPQINIKGTPVGTFLCYSFVFFLELYYICKLSGVRLHFVRTFFKPLLCAALCGAAAWLGYWLLSDIAGVSIKISTIAAILFAAVVYAIALLLVKAVQKEDILSFPKGKKLAEVLEKYHLIG